MTVRNEYPRPQFVRSEWQNLNGEWQFEFDDDNVGIVQKWYSNERTFSRRICVPFVYQSQLSGIGERTPHDIVWYKRELALKSELYADQQVLLHFGAVDYEAQVYLGGHLIAAHQGGHTPFTVDITPYLDGQVQQLALRVCDPHCDESIPRGKQFWEDNPRSIWYTNSTGIWQTVWLEVVSRKRIDDVKFTPLFDDGKISISCTGTGVYPEDKLGFKICFQGKLIARGELFWQTDQMTWDVDLIQNKIFRTNFHDNGYSWSPEQPNLFDVALEVLDKDGVCTDNVDTYFGFRKIHTQNGMVYLNNKPYYQRLVLDQGYWPEGLMTAPDDEAFRQDILLAKEMGFNGCRKHQKMEDPRFLYWADRMGFIVWGECASAPFYSKKAADRLMADWAEIIDRDYNHPCILVWVPLNESWGVAMIHRDRMQQHFSQTMYHYLHAVDNTRLVISNDGWAATETDICAIHNYTHGQKDEIHKYSEFKETLSDKGHLLANLSGPWPLYAGEFSHKGEPIMLTEFGGIGYAAGGAAGWGYTSVETEADYLDDYQRILDAVLASEGLWGFCYTQLCDVEQEINGILTYDRKPKCDLKKIREINSGYHHRNVR